jgi:glycosyltransferase involved in cell wall biosynthesis
MIGPSFTGSRNVLTYPRRLINLSAPVNVEMSYGCVARNIVKGIYSNGDYAKLLPIGGISYYPEEESVIQGALGEKFDPNYPGVRIYHQFALYENPSKKLRVGFPIFELDNFNKTEKESLSGLDLILVTCDWAKQVIQNAGIKVPAEVVPLGVDRTIFNKDVFPLIPKKPDYVRFGSIGKLEQRKAHHILPEVFRAAFSPSDKVELYLLLNNPFLKDEEFKEWIDYYKSILGDQVTFVGRLNHPSEVAQFIKSCDAMTQVSSAEGWNLPCSDSLAMEVPTITSNYSAMTQYCNSENCFLIESTELVEARDERWFFGQGRWMDIGAPQQEQWISHLREIYKGVREGKKLKSGLGGEFCWRETANQMIKVIEEYYPR